MLVFVGIFAPESRALQAGASRLALDLPAGVPLGGFVYRLGRSSTGQHDPITVRALYLEDEGMAVALVSADLHSITPELRARVLELSPASIAESHIILTATHTHSGPGGLSKSWLSRRYMGRYMEETVNVVAQGIADAIAEAIRLKKRATIGYGISEQAVLTKNMFADDGSRDSQVGVIRVDDSDGNPIAILGNMAAHPTTAPGSDSLLLSADFPGYFCDHLESLSHEDTVAFFLNGAMGDQACTNRENKRGWEWPEYIGKELAVLVKSVSNTINCKEYSISINYVTKDVPESLAGSFLPEGVLFQTLEISSPSEGSRFQVSFLPGEVYAGVQEALSRAAKRRGYSAHLTVGLANDYVMDIAAADGAAVRGDAPGLNVLGPEGADWAMDTIQTLMRLGDYASDQRPITQPVELMGIPGGYRVTLKGDANNRMRQYGATMQPLIEGAWSSSIVEPLRDGAIEVDLPIWGERFGIDTTPIALPVLADRERGNLNAEEAQGIRLVAMGAQEPFDTLHLLRHYTTIDTRPEVVTVMGENAGEDGQLVGYIATAPAGTPVVVRENRPEQGRRFTTVGLAWDTALRVGMNDAGVVMSTFSNRPTMDFSGVLETQNNLKRAVASVLRREDSGDTRVLIADRPAGDARLLIHRSEWQNEEPGTRLYRGTKQSRLDLQDGAESKISREQLEQLLSRMAVKRLAESEQEEVPVVFVVILEPNTKSIYLAVSQGDSFPDTYQRFPVTEDSQ